MTPLRDRALFFGAGLLFGGALGLFLARPDPAPPPPPPRAEAPPAPEVDPAVLEAHLAAVEARPEDPAARAAVGELHLAVRDFGEAAYWLRQAETLAPGDLDLRARLAFALAGAGDVPGAVAVCEAVLAEDPEHLATLALLGRLRLYAEQDLAGGIALWERAIAASPDSPEATALRAEIEALRSAHPPE